MKTLVRNLGIVSMMTILGTGTMFGSTTNDNRNHQMNGNEQRQEVRVDNNRNNNQVMNQGMGQRMNDNQRRDDKTFRMETVNRDKHMQDMKHLDQMRRDNQKITTGIIVGTVVTTVLTTLLSK